MADVQTLLTVSPTSEAVLRIKEIISEDLLRASAAAGGQTVPVMPPITLYPQPPRPVIPPAVPRMPNTNSVPGQGHRPAAPHTGVGRHDISDEVHLSTNCLLQCYLVINTFVCRREFPRLSAGLFS